MTCVPFGGKITAEQAGGKASWPRKAVRGSIAGDPGKGGDSEPLTAAEEGTGRLHGSASQDVKRVLVTRKRDKGCVTSRGQGLTLRGFSNVQAMPPLHGNGA